MTESTSGRSAVQVLVDVMLERARAEYPHVEYSIMMAAEQSLLLPKDADRLWRNVEGGLGYYTCHVYRDHEVVAMPLVEDEQVLLCPLLTYGQVTAASTAPTYIGNLRTGAVTTMGST
jgi:hypothetical protein